MMVQIKPRIKRGLPSTISSAPIDSRRTCRMGERIHFNLSSALENSHAHYSRSPKIARNYFNLKSQSFRDMERICVSIRQARCALMKIEYFPKMLQQVRGANGGGGGHLPLCAKMLNFCSHFQFYVHACVRCWVCRVSRPK